MRKRDHQTRAATPRVLTEADLESPARGGLHHMTLRKMLRTGEAVLPPTSDDDLQRAIEAELGPQRPRAEGMNWNPQRRPTTGLVN
jgi:hypothetical protein